MTSDVHSPWEKLFAPPGKPGNWLKLTFRLVRKHGEPLLLLPHRRHALSAALALYPAQTVKAKIARELLGVLLRAGLPVGTESVVVLADAESPFLRFATAPEAVSAGDCFAVLFGNPRAPGPRMMLLVLDREGRACKVIKAGTNERAQALVRAEAAFLNSMDANRLHAPAVLGEFAGVGIAALALEYAPGKSPTADEMPPLAALLSSWLITDRKVKFFALPAGQRLRAASGNNRRWPALEARLAAAEFHPAIFHGDFTPWNIRVHPVTQRWQVLDWERGEAAGPPAWDWFHFIIQHQVLVRRVSPAALVDVIEGLHTCPAFRNYAGAAGIETLLEVLLVAYMHYCQDVLRQTEGLEVIEAFCRLAAARWLEG